MSVDKFIDENLVIGKHLRCPLIPLRRRCEAAGLTIRKVLAEVRSRYGNRSWLQPCRLRLQDGSRPRGYVGFTFKDVPRQLPPFVAKIWPHLPFTGRVSEFPIPVTARQLAGACRSGHTVMVRQGRTICIARDQDPEFQELFARGKCKRELRSEIRKRDKEWPTSEKPLSPLVSKIWPHLPFRGPIAKFPVPLSVHQLAGACKTKRVAMIRRGDEIYMVRDSDFDYSEVVDLGKDRRNGTSKCYNDRASRDYLWDEYVDIFPHPTPKIQHHSRAG